MSVRLILDAEFILYILCNYSFHLKIIYSIMESQIVGTGLTLSCIFFYLNILSSDFRLELLNHIKIRLVQLR
jgi:hypothetical protein